MVLCVEDRCGRINRLLPRFQDITRDIKSTYRIPGVTETAMLCMYRFSI